MRSDNQLPVDTDPEAMLTLSADRRTVRPHIPPVPLAGFSPPLKLHLDLDAVSVDAMMMKLVRPRAQMVPMQKV
jgi:hypothetical protein